MPFGMISTVSNFMPNNKASRYANWVVVGDTGAIAKSTDGNVWSPAATRGGITTYGMGVAYGKDETGAGLWVAVGYDSLIAKSSDGNIWTPAATVTGVAGKGGITNAGYGVAYGKDETGAGLWVAVGEGGLIAKSSDGNIWTPAATVSGVAGIGGITNAGYGVAYGKDGIGGNLWVAVGGGGMIAKSSDGNIWTPAATKGGLIGYGYGVAYGKDGIGGNLWVVVGGGEHIAWSTDGNYWTRAATNPIDGMKGGINVSGRGVAYGKNDTGGNLWVVVGGGGIIAKSTDGNVWSPAATIGGLTTYGFGVAYGKDETGGNLWVAVGPGGVIAKSSDGNYWTSTATVSGVAGKGGITTGRGVAFKTEID